MHTKTVFAKYGKNERYMFLLYIIAAASGLLGIALFITGLCFDSLQIIAFGLSFASICLGCISLLLALIAKHHEEKSTERMKALAHLQFEEKIAVLAVHLSDVNNGRSVIAEQVYHDLRGALELQKWVDLNLQEQLWESIDELNRKANIEAKVKIHCENLCHYLDRLKKEFPRNSQSYLINGIQEQP